MSIHEIEFQRFIGKLDLGNSICLQILAAKQAAERHLQSADRRQGKKRFPNGEQGI